MARAIRAFVTVFLYIGVSLIPVLGHAADSGLLTMVSGPVGYQTATTTSSNASAFMKVRNGDQFNVPSGAKAGIVYFTSGRQELWLGPAQFTVGDGESRGTQGSAQISQLPNAVGKQLVQSPDLSQLARIARPAGVTVRAGSRRLSTSEAAAVQRARETYASMTTSAASDDVTPELYLLAILMDYSLQNEVGSVLDTMQAKQPNNDTIKGLKESLVPASK